MSNLNFPLHPKQWIAFTSIATEILYGGAAGAAKSHLMRVAAIIWCLSIPGLQVYLFRRHYDDLVKNHMEGPTGFHAMLAEWVGKYVQIVDMEIRFNNGSRIFLAHCQHEKDRFKYQGAEMHVLLIDELTHFTELIYRFLRSRVRMPDTIKLKLPEKYKNCFPRVLCGTNPGGVGHQFVKTTWIDAKPAMEIWQTPDGEGGFLRQYIPAKLSDNPSISQLEYGRNLQGLGSEALVKAMLDGDWDVVSGAAFVISRERHMLRPFTPPKHWTKFSSFDWGYVRPYCQGWYCVPDDDTILAAKGDWPEMLIPKRSVIRYRELYGTTGKPNEGSREESEIVVKKILDIERQADERMDYRIADTGIWAKNDGMSTFERMFNASRDDKGTALFNPRQSEKDRMASYNEICARLKGDEIGKDAFRPMFYVTSNCTNWWRTVPSLVLDEINPEKGPDEKQELHAYDETAYALMSRPYVRTADQRLVAEFHRKRREAGLTKEDPYRMRSKGK